MDMENNNNIPRSPEPDIVPDIVPEQQEELTLSADLPEESTAELQVPEDTFACENTPVPEEPEKPEVFCADEDAHAQENTDITTADTVFFVPVTAEAPAEDTPSIDATQVLPSAEELPEILTDALQKEPPAGEDPMAEIHALLNEEPDVETDTPVPTAETAELTPEEIKELRKEARRERRAARRARLDREDAPKTGTFWQKLWYVLRLGDGLFGVPHILATFVWLILVFAIGTSLGRTLWLCAADVLALGKEPHEITLTIEAEDDLETIAQKLQDAGLIRYPGLFLEFAELTEKGDGIVKDTTVTFSAEQVYDYNALINALSSKGGSVLTKKVTIPEGYTCGQIFELLEEKGICSVRAMELYCADGPRLDYWFLQEIPEEYRRHKYGLEGFLFPDTYEFYVNDEPERVIKKFLDNFEIKFTQRMVDKYVALLSETGLDLSLYEVIIMASIVEKEKAADLEGYNIAAVFYNRLRAPGRYPTLDSDATINYAIDYYNKGELITDEQINASPYHTYKSPGLTPTPIANPGLSSLDAALDPYGDTAPKDFYYFFVLNRQTNRHEFSQTLEEHNRKLRELGYLD